MFLKLLICFVFVIVYLFIYFATATHGIRKGADTMAHSCTGLSPVYIDHRMGHSVGAVKQSYCKPTDSGDQEVGRALAGVDRNTIEIGRLPPHLPLDKLPQTDIEWIALFPCFNVFGERFRSVFPAMLATLAYRYKYLNESFSQFHPLRTSSVWLSGILPKLAPFVVTGIGKSTISNMVATGVPSYLALAIELSDLKVLFIVAHILIVYLLCHYCRYSKLLCYFVSLCVYTVDTRRRNKQSSTPNTLPLKS